MSRYVDNIIGSINSLFLALLSLVVVYCFVSWSLLQHHRATSYLVALDKLLLLRQLALPSKLTGIPATKLDLLTFFEKAFYETRSSKPSGLKTLEEVKEQGFDEEPIKGSSVISEIPTRLAVGATCDAFVTNLKEGYTFEIITFKVVFKVHRVPSENVQLVTTMRCLGIPKETSAIIFRLDGGEIAFALPRVLDAAFPGVAVSPPFEPYIFQDIERLKEHLPEPVGKYARLEGDFIVSHLRAIDHAILSYANVRLSKYFAMKDFDTATDRLYEEKERDASYLGITAASSIFVRLGPLLCFLLTFELWRRARQLPVRRIRSESFWFALDSSDILGFIYAFLSALLPLLSTVLMYCLFVESQGLSLIVFDRIVSLEGILTLDFPVAPAPGWRTSDEFAVLVFALLFFHIIVLIALTRKLLSVVGNNARLIRRIRAARAMTRRPKGIPACDYQ